ncbi:unnamed protein product [Clonostachys rhizophaga]|uniref:Large ribosomal subunit protein mL67 n=1 Tax=Clonostachys rhizophaga TaxID=160324 RepID=A0A9N9VG89_9HYPO|nr:unnamed protein product [Clonostachys rhizophaga]
MKPAPAFRLGQLAGLPRLCLRQKHTQHSGKPRQPTSGFVGPEGHGEKIWVFAHRRSDQIIYSFKEQLDGYHDLKQLPYNGKKTKPAKLRKDYWSPMATIEFPQGQGAIGRTVFQKLRELKHLHEVQWHEDLRYKSEKEYTKQDKKVVKEKHEAGFLEYKPLRTVKQRGKALNAQKGNAIADMAVVLAGEGAGNRVLVSQAEDGAKDLVQVTVSWANDQDRNFAEEWSSNVTHDLFEEPSYVAEAAALQTTGAQAQPSPA